MGWPQITYIAITMLSLGVVLSQHGQPKTGEVNFWIHLFSTSIVYFLLISGGFFKR